MGHTSDTLGTMANRRNTYEMHLYLPESLREPLKQMAQREERSITKMVELILRRALEQPPPT